MTRANSRGLTAISRWARVALAAAFVASSVACGFVEEVDPTAGTPVSGGTGNTPAPAPAPTPGVPPSTQPAPPAVAAYAVRWVPSTSAGVKTYELTIAPASGGSDRVVNIPVNSARSIGSNRLSYEISLDTDRDHILSLRAYDGSTYSPPSNELLVRASALIASAALGPSAAMAAAPEQGAATSNEAEGSSADADASASQAGDASADDGSNGDSATQIGSSDGWASLEFDGEGTHLEGEAAPALDGVSGSTFAAWLRPSIADGLRRVVFSAGSDSDTDFDAIELAITEGGQLELILRDVSGDVGHRSMFVASLQHDVWQHVALVFDAEADMPFEIFVDGAVVMSDESELGAFDPAASDGSFRIGAGAEGDTFAGRIGHVAVWSRALAAVELAGLSERAHDGDLRTDAVGDALENYWRLGEGDSAVEADLASSGEPIDLAPVMGDPIAVQDAPEPLP